MTSFCVAGSRMGRLLDCRRRKYRISNGGCSLIGLQENDTRCRESRGQGGYACAFDIGDGRRCRGAGNLVCLIFFGVHSF